VPGHTRLKLGLCGGQQPPGRQGAATASTVPFPCGPAGRRRGGALPRRARGQWPGPGIALSEWESPPSGITCPRSTPSQPRRRARARGPATARAGPGVAARGGAGPGLQNKGRLFFSGAFEPVRPRQRQFRCLLRLLPRRPGPGRGNHRPGTGMRRQPGSECHRDCDCQRPSLRGPPGRTRTWQSQWHLASLEALAEDPTPARPASGPMGICPHPL
jgi:hypothetical protein